jgi:hypothetical protein
MERAPEWRLASETEDEDSDPVMLARYQVMMALYVRVVLGLLFDDGNIG